MPATVVVGAQWGDEGKGKIVDLLAQQSDVVCRYQGGPNAGHTIIVDGETWKLRQMPSGVVSGTTSVIGAGCVVDPQVFVDEVDLLLERGIEPSIVVLSGNAHLIMPWHVTIDQASERRLGNLQIGTTRRGIGPAYADKASRIGIRVQDVLDPKILRQKIEVALAEKNLWLERIYEVDGFDLEEVWEQYAGYAERLAPFVGDVSLLVDEALRDGKRVLFEGRAGDDARPRPRHLSVRHVVEPGGVGRGHGDGHRPDADRPRDRRQQGVRDPGRRRAVPVGDRRARTRRACASSAASSERSRDASAAAAGSTWWRCATPCG